MTWRVETNHVYCDVDGTLLLWPTKAGSPAPDEMANAHAAFSSAPFYDHLMPALNVSLVAALKAWQKRSGGTLVIWTKGGKKHAEMAASFCELEAICIAKPDCIIDDASPEKLMRKIAYRAPGMFP